jgi:hypothetical protein
MAQGIIQIPPPETKGDSKATEMIRVWLAHGDVHVSLLLGMWEDAEDCEVDERYAWGNLLADVARHVANGMQQSHGWEVRKTLARIRRAFLDNLKGKPTDIEGGYTSE